ncbi:hypothetical protein ACFQZZ_03285 [Nocardia sp. GCM10030253]|uniref:hypothetical protein n=1 Tax=Nocardia sp. GCM10030253 TaxID=3273404 RepID=UPI0036356ED7
MYSCSNPDCEGGSHNSQACQYRGDVDLPSRRNLVVLGVLALMIVAALVLAAAAVANR